MLKSYLAIITLFACSTAQAQMSLSDQIASVRAAQDENQARQDTIERTAAEREARIAVQQKATAFDTEQRRIAGELAIEQQRNKIQNRIHDEAMADKKRDRDYEDQLRSVQVEQAKIKLLEERQKITTDKQRDQAYEDKLRELALQQRALEAKQAEVRVSRENDVIDHDLRRADAQTDVVQSEADATRNVSEGAKSFMQGLGNVAVKSQSRPETNYTVTH